MRTTSPISSASQARSTASLLNPVRRKRSENAAIACSARTERRCASYIEESTIESNASSARAIDFAKPGLLWFF